MKIIAVLVLLSTSGFSSQNLTRENFLGNYGLVENRSSHPVNKETCAFYSDNEESLESFGDERVDDQGCCPRAISIIEKSGEDGVGFCERGENDVACRPYALDGVKNKPNTLPNGELMSWFHQGSKIKGKKIIVTAFQTNLLAPIFLPKTARSFGLTRGGLEYISKPAKARCEYKKIP